MAVLALRVSIKSDDLDYMARELSAMPQKIPQGVAAAINATLTRCRKIIVNGVQDATTIKNKSRIVKNTTIHKASKTKLSGYINVVGRPVGALQFQNTVSKTAGVTYTAGKADQPQPYRHGFKGIGINNNAHLWIRKPGFFKVVGNQAHYKPNIGRRMEIIRPIYGPRLQKIYERNPQIQRAAEAEAQKVLSDRLRSQVDRFLNRKKAALPAPTEAE